MGDPKKPKRKYSKPGHPWQKQRIEEEIRLRRKYGFKNKTEIWKVMSELRRVRAQARKLISAVGLQAEKEKKGLITSLYNKGLLESPKAELDDVLSLTVEQFLDRRLQTLVYKKQLASTIKQARQMIVHKKIMIGDKVVSSPGKLITRSEENEIKVLQKTKRKKQEESSKMEVRVEKSKEKEEIKEKSE